MRGWIELVSDVNWIDYHGMWAKKARDGSWYVIRWTNLIDAMGERDAAEQGCAFEAGVKRIDLSEVDVTSSLKSYGWTLAVHDGELTIFAPYSGDIVATLGKPEFERLLVECCIQYGLGAPLESFTGSARPLSIRAKARRYVEACIRDANLLAARLARPVNRIGSTAAEYGRGDINSALRRDYTGDDCDQAIAHSLMRKIHGVTS